MDIWSIISTVFVISMVTTSVTAIPSYCQFETFNATCGRDAVVVMDTARYGRMQFGRCVDRDYGYLGCAEDVLLAVDKRCSGRHRCAVTVPDSALHEMQPCPHDLSAYLEASYHCQTVVTDTSMSCAYGHSFVTSTSGHLASVTSYDNQIGTELCPWVIEMESGRRINLTLWDFSLDFSLPETVEYCRAYAVIREPQTGTSHTVCGGMDRVRNVYMSRTNKVEIRLIYNAQNTQQDYFTIEYQEFGCPALPAHAGMTVQYDADHAYVTCQTTEDKWTLICQSGSWTGTYKNCTTGSHYWGYQNNQMTPLSMEMTIAVITAIALVVIMLVLCVGVICIKSRRRNPSPPPPVRSDGFQPGKAQYDANKLGDDKFPARPGDPGMQFNASGGDYTSIRDHQYGRHPGHNRVPSDPRGPMGYPPSVLPGLDRGPAYPEAHAREHIYESPQFDHSSCSASGCSLDGIPVYFELDPERGGYTTRCPAKPVL